MFRHILKHSMVSCGFACLMLVLFVEISYSQDFSLEVIGFRGGANSNTLGLPPTEKEDFEQFDVFAAMRIPGGWQYDSGWEIRFRLNGSTGILQGGGNEGFIGTVSPGIVFRKPEWRLTIDGGPGLAFLSHENFGRQDLGGPIQIVGQGGVTIDIVSNLGLGWRFHHISDAGMYGTNRGVDIHLFELSYHFK
ncbi:MAG: hypothetical protein GKS05_10395 [Nitrospirales bacterium]|nr:hypothetical protein [Nitrospirales bacterium]